MYEPDYPVEVICPICGAECRRFYRDYNGTVLGCEECVEEVSAEEYLAEQMEENQIQKGRHWNE